MTFIMMVEGCSASACQAWWGRKEVEDVARLRRVEAPEGEDEAMDRRREKRLSLVAVRWVGLP